MTKETIEKIILNNRPQYAARQLFAEFEKQKASVRRLVQAYAHLESVRATSTRPKIEIAEQKLEEAVADAL